MNCTSSIVSYENIWLLGCKMPRKSNSIKQIVEYLSNNNFRTEAQIQLDVFDYDRHTSMYSNKKYADMLRRGVSKGIIKRVKVDLGKTKFIYYI